jgi:hypothetical protein
MAVQSDRAEQAERTPSLAHQGRPGRRRVAIAGGLGGADAIWARQDDSSSSSGNTERPSRRTGRACGPLPPRSGRLAVPSRPRRPPQRPPASHVPSAPREPLDEISFLPVPSAFRPGLRGPRPPPPTFITGSTSTHGSSPARGSDGGPALKPSAHSSASTAVSSPSRGIGHRSEAVARRALAEVEARRTDGAASTRRRGADRNRTGVRGFAGLCLTTRPRRQRRPS